MGVVLPDGRGIALAHGLPVRVALASRWATSAPEGTRLKAQLVVLADETGHPLDPPSPENAARAASAVGLPFAQSTRGVPGGWTPEFRLEMN